MIPKRRSVILSLGLKRFLSLFIYLFIYMIALYDRTEFLRCVFVRRRMIYFESKSLYMALTSSCLILFYFFNLSDGFIWLILMKRCVFFLVGLIDISWAIIASNFTDKSTRQCRRRFVSEVKMIALFFVCFV